MDHPKKDSSLIANNRHCRDHFNLNFSCSAFLFSENRKLICVIFMNSLMEGEFWMLIGKICGYRQGIVEWYQGLAHQLLSNAKKQ